MSMSCYAVFNFLFSFLASEHVVMTNQCGLFTLFHRLNKTRPQSTNGEFLFCVDRSGKLPSPCVRRYDLELCSPRCDFYLSQWTWGAIRCSCWERRCFTSSKVCRWAATSTSSASVPQYTRCSSELPLRFIPAMSHVATSWNTREPIIHTLIVFEFQRIPSDSYTDVEETSES